MPEGAEFADGALRESCGEVRGVAGEEATTLANPASEIFLVTMLFIQ